MVVFLASAVGLSATGYAGINLCFVVVWLMLAAAVGLEYGRRTGARHTGAATPIRAGA